MQGIGKEVNKKADSKGACELDIMGRRLRMCEEERTKIKDSTERQSVTGDYVWKDWKGSKMRDEELFVSRI